MAYPVQGADTTANQLYTSLIAGNVFKIPTVDLSTAEFAVPGGSTGPLYQTIPALTNDHWTTRAVDGKGTFDSFMSGVAVHLKQEFEENRITGAEYTKAYSELTEAVMTNATQYLLGKDQAYWQSLTAQVQAIMAKVQLETTKAEYAKTQFEALTAQAAYSLTKIKLANEDAQYATTMYQLERLLPQQLLLLKEQTEAQRAQTMNTRTDGVQILGTLGKQRDLYQQQIVSYQRDAEVKSAKLFTDAWITQKTIDEGLVPPSGFTNASIDKVLTALRTNNGFN